VVDQIIVAFLLRLHVVHPVRFGGLLDRISTSGEPHKARVKLCNGKWTAEGRSEAQTGVSIETAVIPVTTNSADMRLKQMRQRGESGCTIRERI
jgi:hypothetical protein